MKPVILFLVSTLLVSLAGAQSSCEFSCSPECRAYAEKILNNCSGGTPPPPSPSGRVSLFHSDSCSDSLIASLRPTVDCSSSSFASAPRTWGVMLRGSCYDIPDVDTSVACEVYKAASNNYASLLYHSDSCAKSELIAAVDDFSDCKKIASIKNTRVWGVEIDGQCHDISDGDIEPVCERLKAGIASKQLAKKNKTVF